MDLFCDKVESQAFNACVSFNISWDRLDSFVWSCGLDSSGDTKDDHLQVQNHHDCIRVARDALVLGSGGSVHKSSF